MIPSCMYSFLRISFYYTWLNTMNGSCAVYLNACVESCFRSLLDRNIVQEFKLGHGSCILPINMFSHPAVIFNI